MVILTHDQLVQRAVRWLHGPGGCTFAFSEFRTGGTSEIPDAIGFQSWSSTVVECKASRADFLRDRDKPTRRVPSIAMGTMRYYLVPAGLIYARELPPKWGLLYIEGRHTRTIRKSEGFPDRNHSAERSFLISMLRRVEIRAIRAYMDAGNRSFPVDFLNQLIRDGISLSRQQEVV